MFYLVYFFYSDTINYLMDVVINVEKMSQKYYVVYLFYINE